MRLSINQHELQELIFGQELHDILQPVECFTEKTLNYDHPDLGRFHCQVTAMKEVAIYQSTYQLPHSLQMVSEYDREFIEMHFTLNGKSEMRQRGQRKKHHFHSNQHNLYYSSGFDGEFFLAQDDAPLEYFEIHFSKDYFFNLLRDNCSLQGKFLRQIEQGNSGFIHPNNLKITPEILWIIQSIKNCQRTGHLKKMYLESKVIELLMLQLEQIEQENSKVTVKGFKKEDYDKIQEARLFLNKQFRTPPTLTGLAKLVGLNEFKLKKGFKGVFGTTVFGYIHQLKMQEAQVLLREGEKSVSETSLLIGYKNPQHFTAAFKKYFGLLPSQLI
ncbi:AraC family transcriptional regulator [Rapidithrix thailandica]|uniref:AraC family transcriptional regulator n=1 Tax=Rapidithrix thailandica TaxID=413964 RepID=A0AAW9S0J2_9BACT